MAHQPMHINDWIEIDKDYKWYLDQKAKVIKEKGWCERHVDPFHMLIDITQGRSSLTPSRKTTMLALNC